MKRVIHALLALLIVSTTVLPIAASADAKAGDTFVTLGKDLTIEQKDAVLRDMGVSEDVETIFVTNEEEHQYLGDYISANQIGSNAISSAKITILEKGEGLDVQTNHITWVTDEMYTNALMTAGVQDAEIFVTAPFDVSGTAGLTGILKAFDAKTDLNLSEEQKKVANEELVRTAELGEEIGKDEAAKLITQVKQELAENPVETEEDLRQLIKKVADRLGIELTDAQLDKLVNLFNRIKNLDIDWGQFQNELEKVSNKLGDFLNDQDTRSFFQKVFDILGAIVEEIKSWF